MNNFCYRGFILSNIFVYVVTPISNFHCVGLIVLRLFDELYELIHVLKLFLIPDPLIAIGTCFTFGVGIYLSPLQLTYWSLISVQDSKVTVINV